MCAYGKIYDYFVISVFFLFSFSLNIFALQLIAHPFFRLFVPFNFFHFYFPFPLRFFISASCILTTVCFPSFSSVFSFNGLPFGLLSTVWANKYVYESVRIVCMYESGYVLVSHFPFNLLINMQSQFYNLKFSFSSFILIFVI